MTFQVPMRTCEDAFGEPPAPWAVWCDGSSLSNPGPAGWAVYVEEADGKAYSLHGSADRRTNNEAELHALYRAIKLVPPGVPAVIRSDSEYSINAATKYRPAWEANGMMTSGKKPVANAERIKAIWAALDERPGVRLEWVRGHAGDRGNEIVDGLARGAAEAVRAGGVPVKGKRRVHPVHTSVISPLEPAPRGVVLQDPEVTSVSVAKSVAAHQQETRSVEGMSPWEAFNFLRAKTPVTVVPTVRRPRPSRCASAEKGESVG